MREEFDDDPKKPHPVRISKKGLGSAEAREARPPLRKDADRDHHRHVC